MKRFLILSALLVTVVTSMFAQRKTDALDRGLIAIQTANGVYCSWRIMGEEYYDVTYNLYRDGTKVNSEPLSVSNFTDAAGTASSKYTVKAVVRGTEQSASKEAAVWSQSYLEITPTHEGLKSVYVPNDACCADVTGDGQLEILMKFDNQSEISQSFPKMGPTIDGVATGEYSLFECLKLDGTRLWYVNCGPNMGDFQNNEQNIVAYDWDGDGKAEAIMRAADGTTIYDAFGNKHVIGDATKNYRAATGGGANWFMHDGAEYLVYMNGETGVPYQIMEYPLKRLETGETDLNAAWGDGYGHRSSKHFFGAPYLDGRKPSIFLGRGIYTRHKFVALDVNPSTHQLEVRWRWNCNDSSSPWYGNGYHNYAIVDVDWDGRDEIVWGSMVIDDNGKGLSTTGFGHGDAQHHGDFNPYKHGQEIFACIEDAPYWGNAYRDGTTAKIYHKYTSGRDDGRCMAGNFSNDFPGAMAFSGYDNPISCVTADYVSGMTKGGIPDNFRIYWDGDLCDEGFNYSNGKNTAGAIIKYNKGTIQTLTGSMTNNDTKGTPCYQGDLFGDWREEVMMRTADNKIRIYSTTIPTEWRNYTLWHDMQYRNAMVWQMCGYNQPPHVSYFLGELEGITMAPPALTNTNRTEIANGGSVGSAQNDQQVMLAETNNMTVNVSDGASPYIFFDNAPSWVQGTDENGTSGKDAEILYSYYTHTLTGGAFTGAMRLVKQGDGTLVLPNVTETYTGNTDVWAGTLQFDGTMQSSPVWLNRHTNLISNGGQFNGGIKADYNATIYPGGKDNVGTLTTTTLALGFGSRIVFDVNTDGTADQITATKLTIEKKDWQNGPEYNTPVIEFNGTTVAAGKYEIATIGEIEGDIENLKLEGLNDLKKALSYENGKLYLNITMMRAATDIVWNGATDGIWDFANTTNFTNNGENDFFVSGDAVTFDDNASQTQVNITEDVTPASIVFANNSKNLTLTGTGSIVGTTPITMNGEGNVTINNKNQMTGGITLNKGTLTVNSLANEIGVEYGSLGPVSNAITMNGGTLAINSTLTSSQTISLAANGGTISIPSGITMTQDGTVSGTTSLHKTGTGTLSLGTNNNFATLYIDQGTVNISEVNNMMSVPNLIVFNGNNVRVYDENNSYTYSTNNANFMVTEGAIGHLYLDGRCDYKGKLTGKGTLNVYPQYVRGNLKGNWNDFEGTVVCNQNGQEFYWQNNYGMSKGTMNIPTGSTVIAANDKRTTWYNITLGNLTGGGTLATAGTVTIGSLNNDVTFTGTFENSPKIIKVGSGNWTFKNPISGVSSLTFSGGEIRLENTTTTTLFGNMTPTVKENAILRGRGTISSVIIENGGTLMPGHPTSSRRYGSINSTGSINMYAGTKLYLIAYTNQNSANSRSYLTVGGDLRLNCEINIELGSSYTPAIGDELIFWTAKSILGTPSAINLPGLPSGMEWDTTDLLTTTGTLRIKAATGIKDIRTNSRNSGKIYTLDGKVVENPTKKGVYIQNGKKIVIK